MRIIALSTLLLSPPLSFAQDCTVLLHGLWRTERSMNKMEKSLAEAGFLVRNVSYDSTDHSVQDLAGQAIPEGLEACEGADSVNFVTHSMGGILLRYYLEHNEIERLGRVVMLGPPNQGSEVIDRYGDFPGFEWFSGPAGMELGTGEASVPRKLGPVSFDLGVIAGNRSLNPILSTALPEKDDGKVSVESTRVEGMNDHVEMPVNHVFMMRDREVIEQVIHYLRHGQFLRSAAEAGEEPS
jgi:pimeloyl-ACP methyl ester carboxylesterase